MSIVRSSAILPFAWLALSACAVPKFPAADSGKQDTAPAIENYTCEEPEQVVCAGGGCAKICHRTDVPRLGTSSHCDKPVVRDGMRFDNCEDNNVCLEPAPDTLQGYFCLQLCKNELACPGGVACGERALSEDTTIRVCDPGYQSCEGSCCNPTSRTESTCSFNRPSCYLVPALDANRDSSWTVCEYAGGGASKGDSCTWSRDCAWGLTCVDAESTAKRSGTCLVVCDPAKSDSCGVDGHCQPYPKQWGYCL
jgi:hypothetical protein